LGFFVILLYLELPISSIKMLSRLRSSENLHLRLQHREFVDSRN